MHYVVFPLHDPDEGWAATASGGMPEPDRAGVGIDPVQALTNLVNWQRRQENGRKVEDREYR